MKRLFTYTLLSSLLFTSVATSVLADDYSSTTTTSTTTTTTTVPALPLFPSVVLGSDADYNLDYDKTNSVDCKVNQRIGLTPDQRSKLRNSRIRLEKQLTDANVRADQDANLQGRKTELAKQYLTEYQFRQYLLFREQCS